MATELNVTVNADYTPDGGQRIPIRPGQVSIVPTGADFNYATQNIGTSAEAIAQGDVGTPGWIIVHNMDSTNFVEIGYDDGGFKPTVQVKADEWAFFGISTAAATIQAKADTAAVNIQYAIFEA